MRHVAGRRRGGQGQHVRVLGRSVEHFQRPHDVDSALSHCKSLDFAVGAALRARCGVWSAVSVRSVCCVYRPLA